MPESISANDRLTELWNKVDWHLIPSGKSVEARSIEIRGITHIGVSYDVLTALAHGEPLAVSIVIHELAHVKHRDVRLWGPTLQLSTVPMLIILLMPIVTFFGLALSGAHIALAAVWTLNVGLAILAIPVMISAVRDQSDLAADTFVSIHFPNEQYANMLGQTAALDGLRWKHRKLIAARHRVVAKAVRRNSDK